MKLSMKKLDILKKNIKFKGGLLGLKDFLTILKLLLLRINLHTLRDDSLLGTLKFVSKTKDSQKYGALITYGMINRDIKDSKAYKTYYDFATGKVAPKKARKFKKIASPLRKLSPVKEVEPVKKAKRVKRPAKKFTTAPTAGVVIIETPGVSVSKKKAPPKSDRGKDHFGPFSPFVLFHKTNNDDDDVNLKFLRALPPFRSQVALTLKTRGGLEYLSFDDLYNKLRSLEIDVKGGSSYGSRGTTVALTHSAFIDAASTNTKMVYSDQPSHSSSITYTSAHSGSIMEDVLHLFVAEYEPTQQLAYKDFEQVDQLEMEELDIKWQMAMLSLRINKFQKKVGKKINFNNKGPARFDRRKARCYNCLQLGHFARECIVKKVDEKAKYSAFKISEAKIEKKEWEVKLVESLARFDKWKESSKNIVKLINSSMSTRTKLGLGFKDYNGSDEVFDLSTPSVFDLKPENKEVKSLYERFVKAGEMLEVPPPITETFMPTSYKSDLEETQVTFGSKSNTSSINTFESNDFVSCDNSDKSSATYDFASYVSSPKTNDSFLTVDVKIFPKSDVKDPSPTNDFPSCSFKENVKPPRNLCNKSGIADRIPCKNNFVRTKTCFVCGSKSHLIKDCDVYDNVDNFPYVASKAASIPASSRNSSASISAGRSIPAACRNKPASIHAGRHIPAGRFNKPAPFPAGRYVPTGWNNHAARPFFRPTNLYFDNVSWPRIYDHMS
nr:hypothetical protein [Tanacetum cinerariifolium]